MRLCASEKNTSITAEKTAEFDDAVVEMVVKDYQPLSIVEDTGFRNLVQKLNPKYTLPLRKTLSNELLPNYYKSHKEKLTMALSAVDYIALTCDYWKGINNKNFLSMTGHYIQDDKLHSANLATKEEIGSHTSINTANSMVDICNDWGIYNKIVTVVTDSANNMKRAVKEDFRKPNNVCVAHLINLTVSDAISLNSELEILLSKCRALVTHFKQSTLSAYKLKTKQTELNLPELKLIQDVPTR